MAGSCLTAAESVDGYRQPAASRLEIMDVATGVRKAIYTTTEHIEAPNWSTNGKYLIYNSAGLLYKFPLKSRTPEKINTGEVVNRMFAYAYLVTGTQLFWHT